MKNFTLKNFEKVVGILTEEYQVSKDKVEDVALNIFAIYSNFKHQFTNVEEVILERMSRF